MAIWCSECAWTGPPEGLLKIWVKCTSELLHPGKEVCSKKKIMTSMKEMQEAICIFLQGAIQKTFEVGWGKLMSHPQSKAAGSLMALWPCWSAMTFSFQFRVSYVISWVPEQCSFLLVYQMQTKLSFLRIQKGVPWSRHRDWYHVFFLITVSFHPTNE